MYLAVEYRKYASFKLSWSNVIRFLFSREMQHFARYGHTHLYMSSSKSTGMACERSDPKM